MSNNLGAAVRVIVTGILIVWAGTGIAQAQWDPYPWKNMPRKADGTVDLTAPARRTADGKPDLSGFWMPRESVKYLLNLASDMKPADIPFQPWAAELHRQRVASNSKVNPDAHCLPLGLMQLHTHGQPRKMIQTPGVIVIIYEANAGIRQIFTDGRPQPKDVEPWWFGYSTGKWDGDTLVVETTNLRDLGWLDVEGSPITETGKILERFRRVDYGHLEIEVTIDDPKAYTKPWTVTVHQRIMLDTDLIEFICQENNKDPQHLR